MPLPNPNKPIKRRTIRKRAHPPPRTQQPTVPALVERAIVAALRERVTPRPL